MPVGTAVVVFACLLTSTAPADERQSILLGDSDGYEIRLKIGEYPTLVDSDWLAVEVETLARQYLECLKLGEPPVLPDEEIERVGLKFKGYGQGAQG